MRGLVLARQKPDFHELLATQHYAPVPFPLPLSDVQQAAENFLRFLALPERVKRKLHIPAQYYRASADGYTDKSGAENKDPKQFFHWNPELAKLASCQELQTTHPEIEEFFGSAKLIYRRIESVLNHLFSQHLACYRELVFDQNRLIDGTLRFLCYAPQPNHDFAARPHFDKGFSTLAIADSASGLRIGCCNSHPLKQVRYQAGTALFMPAWMLFQASGGDIKPAWHDVIHTPDEPEINTFCARWSIVFFVNSPDRPFSSWETVHTPLH